MFDKIIEIASVDITSEVAQWKQDSPDTPLTSSVMFRLALYKKEQLTRKELKALRRELLANPKKYKDVFTRMQNPSENYIEDIVKFIDWQVYLDVTNQTMSD